MLSFAMRNTPVKIAKSSAGFDFNAEGLLDSFSVIMEGPFGQITLTKRICLSMCPTIADFFEGNGAVVIDYVQ